MALTPPSTSLLTCWARWYSEYKSKTGKIYDFTVSKWDTKWRLKTGTNPVFPAGLVTLDVMQHLTTLCCSILCVSLPDSNSSMFIQSMLVASSVVLCLVQRTGSNSIQEQLFSVHKCKGVTGWIYNIHEEDCETLQLLTGVHYCVRWCCFRRCCRNISPTGPSWKWLVYLNGLLFWFSNESDIL